MAGFELSEDDVVLLREWWGDCDRTDTDIERRFRWNYQTIHKHRRELGLPKRQRRAVAYDPSPQEIAEEAKRLRRENLERMRDETDAETSRRVANSDRGGCLRCFSFSGQCYRQVEPL